LRSEYSEIITNQRKRVLCGETQLKDFPLLDTVKYLDIEK
jgi:hypothetical protein